MTKTMTDGEVFASLAVQLLGPAVVVDETALAARLDGAFADITGDVPARRIARVRRVAEVAGRDGTDDVDLIAAAVAEQVAGCDWARDAFSSIRAALEPLARLG